MPIIEAQREEGAPEWMVSFADMVTILMAFFVVMFSMAGTKDERKEEAVMGSLRKSLGPRQSWPFGALVPSNSPWARLLGAADPGAGDVGEEASDGKSPRAPYLKVARSGERTAVGEDIFFPAGATEINAEQSRRLKQAAAVMAGKLQRIEIRGHAARGPLDPDSPFADHWELAYARCRLVLAALVEAGIDPERIRLSVAPLHKLNQSRDPRWQGQDSCVDIFFLNEFGPVGKE